MSNLLETRLKEIEDRRDRATKGPWKVGEETLPGKTPQVQRTIHTAWDNAQVKGPEPVVTYAVSPYCTPNRYVYICKSDAEFIAHSREDIDFLLKELRAHQKGS